MFYCLCQSAFYILAFRGYDSKGNKEQLKKLQGLKWSSILLNNPLEPLKYCLVSVSIEFLKAARALGLMSLPWINHMENQLEWIERDQKNASAEKSDNKRLWEDIEYDADVAPMTPMRKKRRKIRSASFSSENGTEKSPSE